MPKVSEAIRNCELQNVQMFVENEGFDVNSSDRAGCTPLFYAVSDRNRGDTQSRLTMIRYLLSRGADVNAAARTGATALHVACAAKQADEIIKFLIDNGADTNATDKNGRTYLHYVCGAGRDPSAY